MPRILTLVVSCAKNQNLWAQILSKNIDDILILCGKPLKSAYSLEGKVLYLNCNDAYEGLPEKMIFALNAVRDMPMFNEITHVLKVDDHDVLFSRQVITNLEDNGAGLLEKHDYVGQHVYTGCAGAHHIGRCPGSPWNKRLYEGEDAMYAAGGYSYILSARAAGLVCEAYGFADKDEIGREHVYEDLMVAIILRRHGIYPVRAFYGIRSTDPLYAALLPGGPPARLKDTGTNRFKRLLLR